MAPGTAFCTVRSRDWLRTRRCRRAETLAEQPFLSVVLIIGPQARESSGPARPSLK
jgi:hypothetical protein